MDWIVKPTSVEDLYRTMVINDFESAKRIGHSISLMSVLNDPLISAIFKCVRNSMYDVDGGHIYLLFPAKRKFFEKWLIDSQPVWIKFFLSDFGENVKVTAFFEGE